MFALKHITTAKFDWLLAGATVPILAAGLVTMHSFLETAVVTKQLIAIALAIVIGVVCTYIDPRVWRRTWLLMLLYLIGNALLVYVLLFGDVINGAQSWIRLGGFSFQPADMMKLVLIMMLAKYFSHRHIEVKRIKHIIISGVYMLIPFLLILLQPDFGSAIIMVVIWFGIILTAGISKRNLLLLLGLLAMASTVMWTMVFQDYQRTRITSFLNPLEDIRGTGYNAYQSTIAVGSGQLLGKGVGYGTQSRLKFLPEYQTDFIFAAFSEEWGFVGAFVILTAFGVILWRILRMSMQGATNFESLFGVGVVLFFGTQIVINIGMNVALLPVSGIPLPLMSKGGSHILIELAAIGIIQSMYRHRRTTPVLAKEPSDVVSLLT